jgi:hypothetical protein
MGKLEQGTVLRVDFNVQAAYSQFSIAIGMGFTSGSKYQAARIDFVISRRNALNRAARQHKNDCR